jgi:hypothetical protein
VVDLQNGQTHQDQLVVLVVQAAHLLDMEHKLRVLAPLIKDMLQAWPHMVIQRHIMVLLVAAALVLWAVMDQQLRVVMVVWALHQQSLVLLFIMRAAVVVLCIPPLQALALLVLEALAVAAQVAEAVLLQQRYRVPQTPAEALAVPAP